MSLEESSSFFLLESWQSQSTTAIRAADVRIRVSQNTSTRPKTDDCMPVEMPETLYTNIFNHKAKLPHFGLRRGKTVQEQKHDRTAPSSC